MTDTASLKALAEKATPGPWSQGRQGKRLTVNAGSLIVATAAPQLDRPANAAYIAAASPDVILRLCEVVEKAREVIGWFPGPAAWHTTAPTDAAEALRSALAALEDGRTAG